MNDEQKLKMLNKFAKDFQKFMAKHPDVSLLCNQDGDVVGHVSLQMPSYKNKYGNIQLTYSGMAIQ